MKQRRIQTKFSNLSPKIIILTGFVALLIHFGYSVLIENEMNAKVVVLVIFTLFIFLFFINREPHFIHLKNGAFYYRLYPFLIRRKIKIKNLKGFSKSTISYYHTGWEMTTSDLIILYRKKGKSIFLKEFNYIKFKQISSTLKM